MVSKDADDINGVEASAGYGDGPGSPQDFRAYVLFGKSFRFKRFPTIGVVLHASGETYLPPRFTRALTLLRSASPAPPGPHVYTITADSNPSRSWIVNLDGKVSIGPVTLAWAYPLATLNNALTFDFTVASGFYDPVAMRTSSDPVNNSVTILDRYLTLQYKSRFLKDRIGLDAKLYGIQFVRGLEAVLISGNPRTTGPVTMKTEPTSYRVGFSIDGDAVLPLRNRLLFGGDVFHELVPGTLAHFSYIEPQFLNLPCPQAPGSTQAAPIFVPECPQQFVFGASRTVAALYVSDQFRPHPRLTLDGGVRFQAGFGQRGYTDAPIGGFIQPLGSASVVWNFFSDMNLKANYTNGFRPPVFNNTDSNGRAIQFGGNSRLASEQSQAFQGEYNARLLKNIGPIRQLQLRVDYAYTELQSLIIIANGRYTNQRSDSRNPDEKSQRHIHSVEGSARMFLSEHTLSMGYTFMDITTNDRGRLRNLPQHWFTLGWVLGLLPRYLDLNGTLLVTSSYDDPNRIISVTQPGTPATATTTAMPETRVAQYADVAFDRIGPQAMLNLGMRTRMLKNRLWASLNFYNVLNVQGSYPDPFYDLAPTLEVATNPRPGWSMFFQIGGKPF
ncbi:MAG: TonB-dependent receptor [Polyangia bacterium]